MMNASSNFEIIAKIVDAIRKNTTHIIHTPGVAGYLGGYPVRIDFRHHTAKEHHITFVEEYFSLEEMQLHNRQSIACDGIEEVKDGVLTYTDQLREKIRKCFNVTIPKFVPFDKIEETAQFLITEVIEPSKVKIK